MKPFLSSALLTAALIAACGATKVNRPPPPPAPKAPAASAQSGSTAGSTASSAASEPRSVPRAQPVSEDPAPQGASTATQVSAPAASPREENAQEQAPEAKKDSEKKPASPDAAKSENAPLGWIAGQPLSAEELLIEWGDVASRELWMVIDKLVSARLAQSEADRLGIRLSSEDVEQRYAAERQKLEKRITRGDKAPDLEKFIQRELGFEPARYLERMRRATIRQMLAERAVRAASLGSESVALRLIVVPDEEAKKKVADALAAGRDFASVAEELSVDDSKKTGGLVPFIVKDERSPLSQLAFQTEVGAVAGPLPLSDHQFWIKVEERRAPLEGDWAAIGTKVEESLAKTPVGEAEFVHWKLTMEGRYPIDLGPLQSLIGAAH